MELLQQLKQKDPLYEVAPAKYIDGLGNITTLNEQAIKADYNRQLDMDALIKAICLDKGQDSTQIWNYKFPITFSMVHNDTEIRVVFSWGEGSAQLDMSFEAYDALPKITPFKP